MAQNNTPVKALVLAGGGARGSYQVGVWRALTELGWRPQIITGTSVGSLNGAMFALDLYETARDMWLTIRSQDVMELPAEDAPLSELHAFLKDAVTQGGMDVTPLEEIVERVLDEDKLRKSPIRPIALDLSDLSSIDAYQALLEQEQPEIRMLVNAAGCGVFGPFAEADRKKLISSAQLNSLALTGMCHASLPFMHSGSNIINMGSNSAWQPVPYQAVYGASKSYVLSLSRAIGRELRPQGIHVMCVCPGWIKTEFQQVAHHDEYIRYVDKWYGPDEVAAQAMQDLKKKKSVSILGHPVRRQVRLVKLLPVDTVMDIWCKQQGIE